MNFLRTFWRYRDLIRLLTWREISGRYKGSFLGLGWSFVHPVAMLIVYTFVFSSVFKAKWGIVQDEGKIDFALTLFMGLIVFRIFAETANSSSSLIMRNGNYVKKVVFPLEILPFVNFLNAMITAFFSLMVLVPVLFITAGGVPLTALMLPPVLAPIVFFSLGIGYLLSSIGVFIRDMGATVEIIVNMLMFLCPVFYPIHAVPEQFRIFVQANPIAMSIEDARRVLIWGMFPDWPCFLGNFFFSFCLFIFGVFCFMKLKKDFAEIL